MRFRVLTVDSNRHLLVVHTHHIALDGWSEQVLMADLCAAYRTRTPSAETTETAVLSLVSLEARQLDDRVAGDLPYWRDQLAEAPPILPKPVGPGEATRREAVVLVPAATVTGLAATSAAQGIPLSATLMAAAAMSLAQQFDADTMTLGAVASARSELTEHAVGYFVNPYAVPLRTLGPPLTVLRECAARVLDGLQHAGTPFDEIVQRLSPARDRHPWLQTLVVLQAPYVSDDLGDGATVTSVRVSAPTTATELTVEAFPTKDGAWECVLVWRADGLDELAGEAITHSLAEHLGALATIAGPEAGASAVAIFPSSSPMTDLPVATTAGGGDER